MSKGKEEIIMTKRKYPKPKEKDGRFICKVCGKDYASSSSYSRHFKNKHSEEGQELNKTDEYTGTKTKARDILKQNYGLSEKQLERILIAKKQAEVDDLKLEISDSYKFGAIADTHLCSNHEKITELNKYYDICKQEGITDVYHAGDIIAGQGIFRGQEYEIHTFGADNQVEYVVNNYPKRDGITTHFILGNHDYIYYKKMGIDVGKMIDSRRKDLNYLGQFQADVMWSGIRLIRLLHPDGGMPYALSYRAQKIVEQISSGEKPRILLMGHLHTEYKFNYRNIDVVGCGCFEGQSAYLLRKGINPVIGGYIIEIKLLDDEKRSIFDFNPRFIKLQF